MPRRHPMRYALVPLFGASLAPAAGCASPNDDPPGGDGSASAGADTTADTASGDLPPATFGDDASTSASDTQASSGPETASTSGADTDSGSDSGTHVPSGVLFFDDFEYEVPREGGGKFGPDGPFAAHGWSWGKDAVENGPGAGGWLYTASAIPGFDDTMPGVASSRVLCVESGAGTYANVIEGAWRQTDFYLQYGDPDGGSLDTIPPDVWFQQWIYLADDPAQPSLVPPTVRMGKWIYPTRNGYPSTDLEWLFTVTGVMVDAEVQELGSSAQLDIGVRSIAVELGLTDDDDDIFTDDRPDATTSLGHCGGDPAHLTAMDANRWWLMRAHIDHTTVPGTVEVSIRPRGGGWIPIIDTDSSAVVEWNPVGRDGHRGLRFPTTMSNWYQEPDQQTTHGDWWIYIDDFAIAAGVNAGGGGADDLPQYDDCDGC